MALPFIIGLAIGAGAVIAFNNKDKLKDQSTKLLEKTKGEVGQIKDKLCATKECIEAKIEKKATTKTQKAQEEKPKVRKTTRRTKPKEEA